MNKIDEYKSKIRWDVWEDVTLIKHSRNAILAECLYDGGDQDRLAGNRKSESQG